MNPAKDNLEVVFHRDYKLDDGRWNNNGWLQEFPDPITKITWDNCALIAPALAREQRIAEGGCQRAMHHPARGVGASFDLRPAGEARNDGQIPGAHVQVGEGDARRVVGAELHLNFADGGAERWRFGILVAKPFRNHQRFSESMLGEEAR
jgi:hypothetical protein